MDDIDLALATSLKSLTLGEKALGQSLMFSERIHGSANETGTVWLRAPSLNLAAALTKARDLAAKRGITIKFVNIFCDTLRINDGESIRGDAINTAAHHTDGSFVLQIYARQLRAPSASSGKASLRVYMVPTCTLVLWTPEPPLDFELDVYVEGQESPKRVRPQIEPPKFGLSVNCSPSGELRVSQQGPQKSALVNINYLDLINEDGTMKEQGYQNDELPRLLQMQMLVAQAQAESNRDFAVALLNYVIVASGSSVSFGLHYHAVGLRNSLALGRDLGQVPSVNVYSAKQVLKARLAAAAAFEESYRDYLLEGRTAKQQVAAGLDLLAKSNDALDTYKFIIDIRQREYDNAARSNDIAKANFDKTNVDVAAKIKMFEAGVEQYKKDKEAEARKEILKGVFSVVLAIGATVATAGAAAPGIVAAGAGIASSVAKAASLMQKLKAIYEKLKAIFEKIKPILEKLGEILETSKKMVAMLDKLKKDGQAMDSADALKHGKDSGEVSDVGIAEWQRFNATVSDMQDYLSEYDIAGKREYFLALRFLVISGECYIKTQASVVQKGNDLAILSFQNAMEEKDKQRLAAMSYSAVTDDKILDLLKRAMFDRVLALRSFVYADFYTYSLAYNYHALSRGSLLRMSPLKPVVDYLEDAAILQGAVASYGSRALVQARKFTFSSLCGYEKAADLAEAFRQSGSIECTIDPQDAQWKGFSRIRMSSARCYLDNVKMAKGGQSLKLQLETSGRFYDRDSLQEDADKLIVPIRAFVGDPRKLLFEYRPQTNEVVTDGLWGQERDYTKHTPLTTWKVSVPGWHADTSLDSSIDIDWSGLTGVTMEFVCDVIWSGY
ncbi:hypothetical protein V8F33_007560 [Rhypophila sp. PSN 637]